MFRAVPCSSSGGQIVSLQHLISSLSVNGCTVCLLRADSSHLHRLIIPDDALIQFDVLMMSIVMLETCREMK